MKTKYNTIATAKTALLVVSCALCFFLALLLNEEMNENNELQTQAQNATKYALQLEADTDPDFIDDVEAESDAFIIFHEQIKQ